MPKLTKEAISEGALLKHVIEVWTVIRPGETLEVDAIKAITEGEVTDHVIHGGSVWKSGVCIDPLPPEAYLESLSEGMIHIREGLMEEAEEE